MGFTIITRRFKSRSGEIDLVALDGEILVLVEVKQSLASGAEARIDEGKIERLRLAADEYMLQYPGPYAECRFDVVTVCAGEFHHYRDALPWA